MTTVLEGLPESLWSYTAYVAGESPRHYLSKSSLGAWLAASNDHGRYCQNEDNDACVWWDLVRTRASRQGERECATAQEVRPSPCALRRATPCRPLHPPAPQPAVVGDGAGGLVAVLSCDDLRIGALSVEQQLAEISVRAPTGAYGAGRRPLLKQSARRAWALAPLRLLPALTQFLPCPLGRAGRQRLR